MKITNIYHDDHLIINITIFVKSSFSIDHSINPNWGAFGKSLDRFREQQCWLQSLIKTRLPWFSQRDRIASLQDQKNLKASNHYNMWETR